MGVARQDSDWTGSAAVSSRWRPAAELRPLAGLGATGSGSSSAGQWNEANQLAASVEPSAWATCGCAGAGAGPKGWQSIAGRVKARRTGSRRRDDFRLGPSPEPAGPLELRSPEQVSSEGSPLRFRLLELLLVVGSGEWIFGDCGRC